MYPSINRKTSAKGFIDLHQHKIIDHQTVKSCSEIPIQLANFILHLNQKSIYIYNKTSNIILKSFAQGIINYIRRLNGELTSILTQIQKQSGNISNFNDINQQYSFEGKNDKLSLLKVCYLLEEKYQLIEQLVNIINKLIPFAASSSQEAPTNKYQVIQILFDQFYKLINVLQYNQSNKSEVLLIYQNSLAYYIKLIQSYIQMNPYELQIICQSPIFIQLSHFNFILSKTNNYQNKFSLNRITKESQDLSKVILQSKQTIIKNQQFVQLFFKLDHLLISQYLPILFHKTAQSILQLGKIIQFVFLYFSIQEKVFLSQYLNVKQQFFKLFNLFQNFKSSKINIKNCHISQQFQQNNSKSMFLNNQFTKKRKYVNISERLDEKIRKPLRNIKIQTQNPCDMFQNTRGIFVDCQTTLSTLKLKYSKQQVQFNDKKPIQSIDRIQMDEQKAQQRQGNSVQNNKKKQVRGYEQNFVIKFERILEEIIQRLYEKVLYFFQQKSQKQFFKLQSHINIPSQSSIILQNNLSNFNNRLSNYKISLKQNNSIFMNKNNSLVKKQNNLLSIHDSLSNIPNHQRIIQSISITLIGIKKFMLYQQGDFFIQLISSLQNILQVSAKNMSKNVISSYIQQSIKSSSVNFLPQEIKNNISFLYLKKSKSTQTKYLKLSTIFSILYTPQFPVNCIFNQQIMYQFGQVFNFIFNIKYCQFILKNIWSDFKQNAKILTQYSLFQSKRHPFESKILAIRNNLHHFVNAIFGFIMISIQSLWTQYIQQINFSFLSNIFKQTNNQSKSNRKLHNPISLIKLTTQLIKNLKLQTVQNLALTNAMILTCEVLSDFKDLLKIQPESGTWNKTKFQKEFQMIHQKFQSIMEIAKYIQGVSQIITYNDKI